MLGGRGFEFLLDFRLIFFDNRLVSDLMLELVVLVVDLGFDIIWLKIVDFLKKKGK